MISGKQGTELSPTDVDALLVHLKEEAARLRMSIESLGPVGEDSLLLLQSSVDRGPHVLVAAGFHGEEPAGCWGVLRFLRQATLSGGVFSRVRLSILPVVNPTGIRRGQRNNLWGENPNRGFCHTPSGEPQPSVEGKLLLQSLPTLRVLAADGFISLHEDIDAERFYLYTFENDEVPGSFTEQLVAAEARFFTPFPDGELEGEICKGGVLYRQCDGSFEDCLFHEGIPRTACTETPGLLAFDRRVEANAHLIDTFCAGAASRQ